MNWHNFVACPNRLVDSLIENYYACTTKNESKGIRLSYDIVPKM
jgi:hypothetical protein